MTIPFAWVGVAGRPDERSRRDRRLAQRRSGSRARSGRLRSGFAANVTGHVDRVTVLGLRGQRAAVTRVDPHLRTGPVWLSERLHRDPYRFWESLRRWDLELAPPAGRSRARSWRILLADSTIALAGMTASVGLAAWFVPDNVLDFLRLGALSSQRWLIPLGFACLGGYYVLVAAATRTRRVSRDRVDAAVAGPERAPVADRAWGTGCRNHRAGDRLRDWPVERHTLLLFSRVIRRSPGLLADISLAGNAPRRAALHARFPLVASWTRLIDMAGSGPILFLLYAACYSSEIAGYMFLAERVIMRPLLIVHHLIAAGLHRRGRSFRAA